MGVVRIKALDGGRPPSHTIAMLVSQIGWRAGPWPRRLGVAVMKARAAHQQLVGVLRSRAEMPWQRSAARSSHMCGLIVAALAFVPSPGAQRQLSEGSDRRGELVKALAFVPSSGAKPLSDKCDDSGLHR